MTAKTRILPWVATAALVAGAWALHTITLDDDDALSDLVTTAAVGAAHASDNLDLTVTDVRAGRSVVDASGWSTDGIWLVVDLDAAAVHTQTGASVNVAELVIGERTFTASERPASMLRAFPLVPGVPRSGSLAFELPNDLLTDGELTGTATLRLGSTPLSSLRPVIEIALDLASIPLQSQVTVAEPGWTN